MGRAAFPGGMHRSCMYSVCECPVCRILVVCMYRVYMQCVYAVCICRMLCNLCMCCVWAVCVCCAVYAACHCVPLRVCHVYVSPLWVSFVRVPFLCAVRYAYWCACVCCVPLVCAVCFLCVWALSYEVYYMGCCVPVRCLCLYDVYWVSAPHVCVICMCRVMCMCRLSVCDVLCVWCVYDT